MKKRLILPALAVLLAACCAVTAFSSGSNVVITLSYLTGTFQEQLTAALRGKLGGLEGAYYDAVEALQGQTDTTRWVSTSTLRPLYPQPGETVTLSAGSGLTWYAGMAVTSAPLIDVTAGYELAAGDFLIAGHRYLAEEQATVTASSASHCGAEGTWAATATGSEAPAMPVILTQGLEPDPTGTAYNSPQSIEVDGVPVEVQMYALHGPGGTETNYIWLRDLACILNGSPAQFAVDYVEASSSIVVTGGRPYQVLGIEMARPFSGATRPYRDAPSTIIANGAVLDISAFTLTSDSGGDYTYFKLRDLGQALGFNVGWSEERGVYIQCTVPYDHND